MTKTLGMVVHGKSKERPILWAQNQDFRSCNDVCAWFPGYELRDQLPPNFAVPLRCVRLADGSRCYLPEQDLFLWVLRTQLAGLAMLNRSRSLDADTRNKYRFDTYLFQLARRSQHYLKRSFTTGRDLRITRSGMASLGDFDVLPGWKETERQTCC